MKNTRAKLVICTFLIVATFFVYSQVKDHDFLNYDDDEYVRPSNRYSLLQESC